jgi:hypothetical protein
LHEIRIKAVRTANDDGKEAAKMKLPEISAQIDMVNKAFARAGIRLLFDPHEDMIPGPADGEVLKDITLNKDHASNDNEKFKTMVA